MMNIRSPVVGAWNGSVGQRAVQRGAVQQGWFPSLLTNDLHRNIYLTFACSLCLLAAFSCLASSCFSLAWVVFRSNWLLVARLVAWLSCFVTPT